MRNVAGDARGFTLVEALVALTVFGIIAAAGVALLSFSVRAQEAATATLDDLGALERLSSILAADLAQAQDRPTRDAAGVLLPAFSGGAGMQPMLRLVRGGWSNVDASPRASLQKVEYRLTADGIERIGYPALDGAAPLPPALLAEGVSGATWRFRRAGAWSDVWQGDPLAALPQAAELTLTRGDGRRYRMLFLVGAGDAARRVPGAGGGGGTAPPGGGTPDVP